MGLDMYAHSVKADLEGKEVDFLYSELFEDQTEARKDGRINTEFAYWRKFNNLHGWMHDLYKRKGGRSTDFNTDTVALTNEDLDRLSKEAAELEPTSGFFFGGNTPMTEEDIQDVQEFVVRAKQEIANGRAVIYSSWW